MRRRSALSAIVPERLAARQCTGWRKPAEWSIQRVAGRDICGLEQLIDAVRARGREHRDWPVMVGDLNCLTVAHAADRRCQPVAKLPYADLFRHL